MRAGGIGHREGLVDDRADPAVREEGQRLAREDLQRRDLLLQGARAERGSHHGDPLPEKDSQVDIGEGAPRQADHDDPAEEGDALQVSRQIAGADQIQDHVDPSSTRRVQNIVGEVVAAGQAAMTFIEIGTIWITAAFKENSLENIATGDRAEILFDSLPGQLFPAQVESVGLGVSQGAVDPATGLPTIRNQTGWIRDPQRFPVRLVLDGDLPKGVRYGSQATVVIYTGENPLTNALGSFWIRLISVLTYAS